MAKVSPVSIKYMIHANFIAEGALEKPDIIGAIFGQTEGLLGNELEMRDLQKEGKIGRIEVDLERKDKKTVGKIHIPTALDQSETTLIAAAVETIERIGPSDAQIEIERIEDVRGSKRDYIIERAKKLMQSIEGSTVSREISNEIKDSVRTGSVQEYGEGKLPCGDLSGRELIVVEGRADVVNLLRAGVNNVIGMNGTKLPDEIKQLSKEKEITLFVDGDRGGKLIVQNVSDNAEIAFVAVAPDGKEVEELTGKEILMNLRKRISLEDYLARESRGGYREDSRGRREYSRDNRRDYGRRDSYDSADSSASQSTANKIEVNEDVREKLSKYAKKIDDGKAYLLNSDLEIIKEVSAKGIGLALKKSREKPSALVIAGTVTGTVLNSAEEAGVSVISAKNFSATDTSIELLSF